MVADPAFGCGSRQNKNADQPTLDMFEHFDIGVEFIDDNNGNPGVRLRKSPKRRVSTGRDVSAKRTQFLCSKENRRLEPTLEAAGVDFIEENGGGPGVRLRKPTRQKSDEPNSADATRWKS
jgi:hypothetical protein